MTDLKITKDNNNICVYERLNDDCIRLLHMYGKNPVCVVPDMLDGMRVTELAEYCFSFKSMPEKLKTELGIDDILRPDMTELCDDYIERVILPDGMVLSIASFRISGPVKATSEEATASSRVSTMAPL